MANANGRRIRPEDRKDQPPIGRCRVDRSALTGKKLQADVSVGEIANQVDQMAKITAKTVKLPDCERVTWAQRFETCFQTWSIIAALGSCILIDVSGNASFDQRIVLQVMNLTVIRFRDPCIANKHCHLYVRLCDNVRLAPPKRIECHLSRPVM